MVQKYGSTNSCEVFDIYDKKYEHTNLRMYKLSRVRSYQSTNRLIVSGVTKVSKWQNTNKADYEITRS